LSGIAGGTVSWHSIPQLPVGIRKVQKAIFNEEHTMIPHLFQALKIVVEAITSAVLEHFSKSSGNDTVKRADKL